MLKFIATICLVTPLLHAQTAQSQSSQTQTCDRECLRRMLNQYLEAVIKHDPNAVPLAIGFRQTENNVVVLPGSGLWTTMTRLGTVQRRYFDEAEGQAAYFGIIHEGDSETRAITGLRLKVRNNKVSEAEWFISRKGDFSGTGVPGGALFDPTNLEQRAPAQRTVPQGRRLSREEMVAVVNSYFDGLTTHDGSIILAHPGCERTENGVTLTGSLLPTDAIQPNGSKTFDCTSGVLAQNVANVATRRYPVVDDEAGVVMASAVLMPRANSDGLRSTLFEFFQIDGAGIRSIYAAASFVTPELPVPNWPPYDGNFLSSASAGGTR